MKSLLLKNCVPLIVAAVSTTGALLSQADTKPDYLANEQGYIRYSSPTDCDPSDLCSTFGPQACTVGDIPGGTRLWKKNAINQCIITLYRPMP